MDEHVNREEFMLMLARIWPEWARKEAVRKACKRSGVTDTELGIKGEGGGSLGFRSWKMSLSI